MRKIFTALLCLPLCLLGCSSTGQSSAAPSAAGEEITVFAAASLQETLEEISAAYEDSHSGIDIVCSFESSGTLKTQIEEGAPCDIFISAAQKQMDQLDDGQDGEAGLQLIDPATRINLLENKVTLAVPDGNPAGIQSFEDLADQLKSGSDILVAVGNSDVPVGQYTERIFSYYDLNEEQLADEGKLTYGSNVKEVTAQISAGSVACGIIYATDAFSAGLEVAAEADPAMCGQVVYPAAVLEGSTDKAAAAAFLEYLTTPAAMSVFESVGFSPA